MENVIRGYLKMAEERTEAAQQQSSQAVAVLDIDDLDNLATPESLLMSAVCGEDAQDRSDRTILLPWVKFLWESYGQCIELLRVNSHCEILYHDIARMAFQFCLKYNRKMEFRKLSEKLRKHLDDIGKVSANSANVSITKPETQHLNLGKLTVTKHIFLSTQFLIDNHFICRNEIVSIGQCHPNGIMARSL